MHLQWQLVKKRIDNSFWNFEKDKYYNNKWNYYSKLISRWKNNWTRQQVFIQNDSCDYIKLNGFLNINSCEVRNELMKKKKKLKWNNNILTLCHCFGVHATREGSLVCPFFHGLWVTSAPLNSALSSAILWNNGSLCKGKKRTKLLYASKSSSKSLSIIVDFVKANWTLI